MIIISVPQLNDSLSRIVLDGKECFLRFSWNTEGEFWSFAIWKSWDTALVSGIKVVPNYPLTETVNASGMPQGVFAALSNKTAIGKEDFWNGLASFVYASPDEVTANE